MPAPGSFVPIRYLDLRPLPNGRTMLLRCDIEFRARLTWRTRRGLITDGASIPAIFAWLVGGPFEGRHRRAALFHDDYYTRCARSHSICSRA